MNPRSYFALVTSLVISWTATQAADVPLAFNDPAPRRYELSARASLIDPRACPHPEIGFVFEKNGKPADVEKASVDTRVKPQGKLVIWLMGYNGPLFERLNGYGLHAIQVHYANGWFDKLSKQAPPSEDQFLGNIRLEAATGKDFSRAVDIPSPDGMMERAVQFVKWLAKENPPGRWEYFLTDDRQGLRWERIIMAGASHGSTTAARFAKYQRVDRVVMFCGPRDQYETWQGLPSATPTNRFFAFSHVLDGGWTGHHYDRSWELMDLNKFGPVVNVDHAAPPFGNTRRLVTAADVKNDAGRAHSSVVPGGAAVKDASGRFVHEDVWRYLFTHPVEQVGQPVPHDPACPMDLRTAGANQRKTGGARPLLIGEFGMSTARDPRHGVEDSLRARIGDAPGTEAEQARLYEIVLAAAEKDRVAGVLPWCLYDYPIKNPDESRFGLVRSDGSLKPAAQVLRDAFLRWGHRKP